MRKRVDETRYTIRFTPRRPGSTWSAININRVGVLTQRGLMLPAGRAAFGRRSEEKSRTYAYEQRRSATLTPAQERKLRANKKAWAFFQAQAPSYRRLANYWVTTAKKEETRLKRLDQLIEYSATGRRV